MQALFLKIWGERIRNLTWVGRSLNSAPVYTLKAQHILMCLGSLPLRAEVEQSQDHVMPLL